MSVYSELPVSLCVCVVLAAMTLSTVCVCLMDCPPYWQRSVVLICVDLSCLYKDKRLYINNLQPQTEVVRVSQERQRISTSSLKYMDKHDY